MPIISVQKLCVAYDSVEAVCDLSFTIEKGDFIGLAGPNGSGKSTLVKAILGIIKPLRGDIELWGTPLRAFRDWRKIGYLPQQIQNGNTLFPATAREIVELGLLASGVKKPAAVNLALETVGIANLSGQKLSELSGGQQQKVFLARAIVGRPELLVLDEPANALDAKTRDSFFETLKKLNREKQTTIILITHDVEHVGKFANKLLYLDKKLLYFGSAKEYGVS